MATVSVSEARTHFSAILRRAVAGETIVITKRGRPIAELRALAAAPRLKRRIPGKYRGKIVIHDDFDDPLPEFEEYM